MTGSVNPFIKGANNDCRCRVGLLSSLITSDPVSCGFGNRGSKGEACGDVINCVSSGAGMQGLLGKESDGRAL